ncbi:type II toxin-antitoxin system SpoIISA family toxin [Bacillus sp. SA1-12]|uniref:type II toxin-antitoxin system SpoIISA family toxin n=1 Tax=Bacillus sp. SA1-12 TaxID=1455638 RepID=UPI000ADBD375|nr:type II toxin-antitoxin system SpoIISA family toxin [Bacillus sp. SA1-12]
MEINETTKAWYQSDRFKVFIKIVVPIVIVAVLLFVMNQWNKAVLTFIIKHKWLMLIGFTAAILYCSWAFSEFFNKQRQNLRRTWYFLFLIGIVFMLSETGFDAQKWQGYTLLAGMFIFVDLALFLTPSIKKIAGAEMEQINEMENVNDEMKKVIVQTQNRSWQYTNILDRLDTSLFGTQQWFNIDEYRGSLEDFLSIYGETCRQSITVFKFDDQSFFKQEIGTVMGVDLTDKEIALLEEQKLLHIDRRTILIPYIERVFPVVISIFGEKDILDIDTDHIVNLSLIHSWLKKQT